MIQTDSSLCEIEFEIHAFETPRLSSLLIFITMFLRLLRQKPTYFALCLSGTFSLLPEKSFLRRRSFLKF